MRKFALVSSLLSFSIACSDDPIGSLDATTATDGGTRPDARAMDATTRDGGPADHGGQFDLAISPDVGDEDTGHPDAEEADLGETDAETTDAGPECIPDEACTENPGAPCRAGVVLCSSSGPVCVDAEVAPDGTSCPTGACVSGACLAPTIITQDVNLSEDTVDPNRTCAEAPQYSVVELADSVATLTSTPSSDCLAVGDEVLLINLQGAPAATENVGVWELLEVAQIGPFAVSFTTPKTRFYGNAAASDDGIGVGATDQKVALIRVPKFGALSVQSGVLVNANRWDGLTGGVVALRAASIELEGRISAQALGYRPGRWSQDSSDCDDNVATESGESISGPGTQNTSRNVGAPGGISALSNTSFWGNSPLSPSAGHAFPGEPGQNPVGRVLGEPGAAYGIGDGTRLTMGSGASGNLTCDLLVAEPVLVPIFATATAGGIVILLSGDITIAPGGEISAAAGTGLRDVSSSGGYVYLRGANVDVGDRLVDARGAVGQSVNVAGPLNSNESSPGYVVIEHSGSVTGTTTPDATWIAR